MDLYYFFETQNLNDAIEELVYHGLENHCIIEDMESNTIQISGSSKRQLETIPLKYAKFLRIETYDPWEQQWELFAPNFFEGKSHINLNEYNGPNLEFVMIPGPGFGDLSHTTTRLCLELLCETNLKDKTIFDVGCGSGVLSIAASLLGAKSILSIDNDIEALQHCLKNFEINEIRNAQVINDIYSPRLIPDIYAINMTFNEHVEVIKALNLNSPEPIDLIVSGLLVSQKEDFLSLIPDSFRSVREIRSQDWISLKIANY